MDSRQLSERLLKLRREVRLLRRRAVRERGRQRLVVQSSLFG